MKKIITTILSLLAVSTMISSCESIDQKNITALDSAVSIGAISIYDLENIDANTRAAGRTEEQIRYVDSFVEGDIICVETIEAASNKAKYFYYQYTGGAWANHSQSDKLMTSTINVARSVKAHLIPGAADIDSDYSWRAGDNLWSDADAIYPDILQDLSVDLELTKLKIELTRCYNCKVIVNLESGDSSIDVTNAVVEMNSSTAITEYEPTATGMNITRKVIDYRPMRKVGNSYEIMLVDLTTSSSILFTVTTKSGDRYICNVGKLEVEPNKYSTVEITLKVR